MPMTMQPDSKASRVLAILGDGPGTTGETGWGVHLTCAHLWYLHKRGKITRERFPMPDRRVRYLWSIGQ